MVFGAGGDRDQGKRPLMGAIAAEKADRVIVTDDNPRSENPAAIRAAILAAAPGATEIGDRGEAIRRAVAALAAGRRAADRRQRATKAARSSATGYCRSATTRRSPPRSRRRSHERAALDRRRDGGGDAARERAGALPRERAAACRSTPARIEPGEAFFAIQGENRDGHDFVEAALKAGAALAVVSRDKRARDAEGRAAAGRRRRARSA